MEKVEDTHGAWVFLAPISRLTITSVTRLRLVRTEIIRASSLPYIRKNLGFKRKISEFSFGNLSFMRSFFQRENSFISFRLTGTGIQTRPQFIRTTEEELYILSLSQLIYAPRSFNAYPCITDQHTPGKVSYLLYNSTDDSWTQPNHITGLNWNLKIDKQWERFHSRFYFLTLLKILRGEIKVEKHLKETLHNASVLGGMSQCTNDRTNAFLWNMIAIEMLLTLDREKYSDTLPERVEAFIGWTNDWNKEVHYKKIKDCYAKRCKIVHNGDRSCVDRKNLHFTDIVLFNVLSNVVKHHDIFKSKQSIKRFSEKIKAEKLLGIKPKTRPKSLNFARKRYKENDYEYI